MNVEVNARAAEEITGVVVGRVEQVDVIGEVADDVSVELMIETAGEEVEVEDTAGEEESLDAGDDEVDELLSIDDRILSAGWMSDT